MWTFAAVETGSSGGDNLYSLLIVLAVLLLGSGGLLRLRLRRRNPEDADPAEPVSRKVVNAAEPILKARIRELTREHVEDERRLAAERVAHEQTRRDNQTEREQMIRQLTTCAVERSQLEVQMNALQAELNAERRRGGEHE